MFIVGSLVLDIYAFGLCVVRYTTITKIAYKFSMILMSFIFILGVLFSLSRRGVHL